MSTGDILNLLVIVCLFMLLFAIIGMSIFKGRFEYCNNEHVPGLTSQQMTELIVDKYDCINYGGEWDNYN